MRTCDIHDPGEMIIHAYSMYFACGEQGDYEANGFLNQKITADFIRANVVPADDWKYLEGIRYVQRNEAMSALVRAVKKIFTAWQKGVEPYETYAQAMRKDDRQ